MRPLRLLILLLVLASAIFVALIRPLPGHATETVTTTGKKQTRTVSRSQRRHRAAIRARRTFGHRVVRYARRFAGVPYAWGGSSPRTGFDCSGFVRYVYDHFGISLPHSSYGDLSHGRRVLRKYLKPGDIVFFGGGSHVGIYLSGNRVIDALHSGTVVHVRTMTDWYSSEYYTARRFAHAN
jgi:cell wall-associated NlpC family hydrolase